MKKTHRSNMFQFELAQEEYQELQDSNGGFCIKCGSETYGIEPDAHEYECEECGEKGVYGAEELMMMGLINITEEEEEE